MVEFLIISAKMFDRFLL